MHDAVEAAGLEGVRSVLEYGLHFFLPLDFIFESFFILHLLGAVVQLLNVFEILLLVLAVLIFYDLPELLLEDLLADLVALVLQVVEELLDLQVQFEIVQLWLVGDASILAPRL